MTPAERQMWQARLTEAETAYHRLVTGQAAVTIRDQNGETVTYNNASLSRLSAYIALIKQKLGTASAGQGKPIGAYF